jgi:hypothetical protein
MPSPPVMPPAPAPAPLAPAPKASKKPYFIGGGIVLVLVAIASMTNQNPTAPAPMQMPAPGPDSTPATSAAPAPALNQRPANDAVAGIHRNLSWHDHALNYVGNVSWDGRSNVAFISMNVFDTLSRSPLGPRQLQAGVQPYGANQLVISTTVGVAGDSVTPGPHTHSVNLVFQAQPDGGWTFVHNCMSENDCY